MLFSDVIKYLEAIDTCPRYRPLPSPKSPKLILGTIWWHVSTQPFKFKRWFISLIFFSFFQISFNTIRDNTEYKEDIEYKNVFVHPSYQFPSLYDDIAVVELGRRIHYDYDKVFHASS